MDHFGPYAKGTGEEAEAVALEASKAEEARAERGGGASKSATTAWIITDMSALWPVTEANLANAGWVRSTQEGWRGP
jgi:hypothetical protein